MDMKVVKCWITLFGPIITTWWLIWNATQTFLAHLAKNEKLVAFKNMQTLSELSSQRPWDRTSTQAVRTMEPTNCIESTDFECRYQGKVWA